MVSLSNHEGASAAMEATVYIVRCSDGSYYTGLTKQADGGARVGAQRGRLRRLYQERRPATLVFAENYERLIEAIAASGRSRAGRGSRRKR